MVALGVCFVVESCVVEYDVVESGVVEYGVVKSGVVKSGVVESGVVEYGVVEFVECFWNGKKSWFCLSAAQTGLWKGADTTETHPSACLSVKPLKRSHVAGDGFEDFDTFETKGGSGGGNFRTICNHHGKNDLEVDDAVGCRASVDEIPNRFRLCCLYSHQIHCMNTFDLEVLIEVLFVSKGSQ